MIQSLPQGGAINCGIGATTILQSNTFINNGSGGFGPAVYDRYNSGVVKQGNTGCGQRVDTDGFSPVTWNIQCNGVYLLVGLLKTGRCLPFQHQCGTPTGLPSTYPVTIRSIPPSSLPSFKPSKENTSWPLQPSAMPTISQSDYPSLHPSYAVSSVPSANVSPVAVSLDEPSLIPSDAPSVIPSDVPSLAPSVEPSMLSWRGS